jgi:hypothetical protein
VRTPRVDESERVMVLERTVDWRSLLADRSILVGAELERPKTDPDRLDEEERLIDPSDLPELLDCELKDRDEPPLEWEDEPKERDEPPPEWEDEPKDWEDPPPDRPPENPPPPPPPP